MKNLDGLGHRGKKTELITKKVEKLNSDFLPNIAYQKKDRSNFNTEKFFNAIFTIVFIVTIIFAGKAVSEFSKIKIRSEENRIAGYQSKIELRVKKIESKLRAGKISESISELNQLETEIYALKMYIQGMGQDIRYFQYLSLNSEFSQKEKMLDSLYNSISSLNELKNKIADLDFTDYFGNNGTILDIKSVKEKALNIIVSYKKFSTEIRASLNLLPKNQETRDLKEKFSNLEKLVLQAETFINSDLAWLSGDEKTSRNIMIIFQNNRELRGGTGGSLGSFGVARIKDGKLSKIDFGKNIYKLDTEFKSKTFVQSPSELEAFGAAWTMKQAGFAVDGKEAFDKIRWFYEQETGEKADGVISLDTDTFVSLLKITGPIDMPSYGKTLNADNFVEETMDEVQNDYFKRTGGKEENEPKKILADAMPIFLDKIFSLLKKPAEALEIADTLKQSVLEKHLIFNFDNADLQQKLDTLNATGKIISAKGDYLSINNSNLAGMKTNQNMVEAVNLDVNINSDGRIKNSLSLQRNHTGKNIWPDGLDRNYIRVIIPEGSNVSEFKPVRGNFQRYYDRGYKNGQPWWTDKEANKATINFWMSTWPGDWTKAEMEYQPNYQLNMKDDFTYRILFQRQPGAPADSVSFVIHFPENFIPEGFANYDNDNHLLKLDFKVDTDKELKINFRKIK